LRDRKKRWVRFAANYGLYVSDTVPDGFLSIGYNHFRSKRITIEGGSDPEFSSLNFFGLPQGQFFREFHDVIAQQSAVFTYQGNRAGIMFPKHTNGSSREPIGRD
jgi:hypothetical protein